MNVENGGTLTVQNGGTVDINGALGGSGGSLVATGGTLMVNGAVNGSEAITIEGAGIAHFMESLGAGNAITFAGAGLFALDAAPAAALNVTNFGAGDGIDLTNLAYAANPTLTWSESGNNLGGTLTVHDGNAAEAFNLTFSTATALSASDFNLAADPLGSGGTEITVSPPLNYAAAQTSTYAGIDFFGINNNGVAFGAKGADFLDFTGNELVFVVNGKTVTFGAPPSNFSDNLDVGSGDSLEPASSNDSNVIPGSVDVLNGLAPAIFSPSQD